MEKNPESKRITEGENWQFLFKMKQRENNKSYILRFYHNPEMNQIKQLQGQKETIISCPIELDYIICSYLVKGGSDVLITWRLLEVVNNMFTNGCNKCHYLKKWDQMSYHILNVYISKGIIPGSTFFPAMIIDTHHYISKLYAANNG